MLTSTTVAPGRNQPARRAVRLISAPDPIDIVAEVEQTGTTPQQRARRRAVSRGGDREDRHARTQAPTAAARWCRLR